jgi:hypothetical protein
MNRPLWLDLFCLAGFFAPPTLVAALGAFGLSHWLGLPGWAAAVTYAGLAVLAIVVWAIPLVAWNPIRSSQASDPGANRDGDQYRQD